MAAPAADLNPPRVSHEPPQAADANGQWHLWFEVRDESELFGAALYHGKKEGGWKSIEPTQVAPGWLEVVIPAIAGTRYFFEVFDAQGNGPTRVGSAEVPFVLSLTEGQLPEARPWDDKPVVSLPPVTKPWWQQRPSDEVFYGAAGAVAFSSILYGAWALLRARPVAKVTLAPVGEVVLP